jgi:transcriptional regulator with XRE-family HTH domain
MTECNMADATIASRAEREIGAALSQRVRVLRQKRDWSLDTLAARADLSKGTVVAIEQGKANPSIGVLCRLAVAFSMSVTDLLGDGGDEFDQLAGRAHGEEVIEKATPTRLWKTRKGSAATLLASTSGRTMFEIWSWRIEPGDIHRSDAHSPGTLELISVMRGRLQITVGRETLSLKSGEAARLITDQPHSYAAAGDQQVTFTMAVLERGGDLK